MIDLGKVRPGSVIRVPFSSYDKDDGASITCTNYAAADILIYKDGSTTERASTSGYTATTDFDAKTGKHVAIITLSDNTTAGFFAAGSEYIVAIDAVTVDGVTTGGWIARFTIGYEGSMLDTTIATLASQTSFTLTAGPAEDDALNDMWLIIHDVASAVQCGRAIISDYTGSTKTVTLAAGTTFTAAATDNVSIMGPMPMQPATAARKPVVSAAGIVDSNLATVLDSVDPATGLESAGNHYNLYSHFDSDQNLLSSAITSVTSQTIFVLTSGVATDDFYNDMMIVVTGIDSLAERHRARVVDYVGSTKTITIDTAAPWTVNTSDEVNIIAVPRQVTYLPNVAAGGANGLFISGSNAGTTTFGALTVTGATTLSGAVSFGSTFGITGTTTLAALTCTTITATTNAIPWNASWDAEVQSEVADALGVFWTSPATLVDLVWDELTSGHTTAGTTGKALTDAGSAGDPWATALPGAYSAGTAGKIVGDNINAPIGTVDTVVDAIKAVTDNLPNSGTLSSLATAAALATVDTVVDSILVDTAEIGAAGAGLTALATQASVNDLPTLAEILAGGDIDGYTLEQTLKLCLSALAAKLSGAATTTITIRAADDSKTRITATVDADGNRSAVTLDATG